MALSALLFACTLSFFAMATTSAHELPLDKHLSGRSEISFEEEGNGEGMRYLGSGWQKGSANLFAQDYETQILYRFNSHGRTALGEIRGRDILGFGLEESGEFYLLTKRDHNHLIEKFNSRGTRISHISIKIQMMSDELYHIDTDGKDFYLVGPNEGHRVSLNGGTAKKFDGYPIIGQKDEYLNYKFHHQTLEISFYPEMKTRKIQIPLFSAPDHVELFRRTSRGIYFMLETELDLERDESTFFIYKVDSTKLRLNGGLYLSLPYSTRTERFFWFNQEGHIYMTTLRGHEYRVWFIGQF